MHRASEVPSPIADGITRARRLVLAAMIAEGLTPSPGMFVRAGLPALDAAGGGSSAAAAGGAETVDKRKEEPPWWEEE